MHAPCRWQQKDGNQRFCSRYGLGAELLCDHSDMRCRGFDDASAVCSARSIYWRSEDGQNEDEFGSWKYSLRMRRMICRRRRPPADCDRLCLNQDNDRFSDRSSPSCQWMRAASGPFRTTWHRTLGVPGGIPCTFPHWHPPFSLRMREGYGDRLVEEPANDASL